MIAGRPGWLRRFGHETITVHRTSAGARDVHGEWFPGARGTMAVKATTAPEGRQRDVGLGGARLEAERMLWTTERLQAATSDRDADTVTYDSDSWRVVSVERWPNFYEVGLVRLEDQSGATLEAGTSTLERSLRRHIALGSGFVRCRRGWRHHLAARDPRQRPRSCAGWLARHGVVEQSHPGGRAVQTGFAAQPRRRTR